MREKENGLQLSPSRQNAPLLERLTLAMNPPENVEFPCILSTIDVMTEVFS